MNVDCAATALNGGVFLQGSSRKTYGRPVGAEHDGQKIVCEGQRIRVNAILSHEKPARQTLFHLMQSIACGGLRHLHALEDSVAVEPHPKVGHGSKANLQFPRSNSEGVAFDLYDDPERTGIQADGQRHAYSPFVPHYAGLDIPAATGGYHDRG